jgi:hypothetical protein
MASTKAFWDGFQYLILGTILSMILVLFVGVAIDGVIAQLEAIDILNVPGYWGSAASTDIYFWQKLAYVIAISPAILGVIAQVLAAVMREKVEEEQVFTQYSEEVDI